MIERARTTPDSDDGGFADRAVWLETTLGGAGRLQGDLTPECAASLAVILDALSQRGGPEDTRTAAQRRHDALQQACERLTGAGLEPGPDGQQPAPPRCRSISTWPRCAACPAARAWKPAGPPARPGGGLEPGPRRRRRRSRVGVPVRRGRRGGHL